MSSTVKVILRDDVYRLGEAGDVVNVKSGYARNFLVPRGMAIPATDSSLRELEHHKRVIEAKLAKEMKGMKAVRSKVQGIPLEFELQAGEGGKLFGSVTSQQIAARLEENGVSIDRRRITLREPIKSVGEHKVDVKLHRDVSAEVKVTVRAVGAPPPPVEEEDPDLIVDEPVERPDFEDDED